MRNKLPHSWRSSIIFILFVLLLTALFFSRVLLSAGLIGFIGFSLVHNQHRKQIVAFFSNPLLWGMSLLFLVPLISGIWSEDKKLWTEILRIKLPLLFLPLAFARPVELSKKQWEWLGYFFIAIISAASIWCMFHYIPQAAIINESYLRAKTMRTPLDNDHVRFSWLVSTAVLLSGWMLRRKGKENKWIAVLLWMAGIWLILFLHLLAARTGLISFYIMAFITAAWLLLRKSSIKAGWKPALSILAIIMVIPFFAYQLFPSFHNRVQYLLYDKGFFEKAHYLPGSTDAVRVISMKAGWNLLQENPLTGVGFGDLRNKTQEWYEVNCPEMIAADKIYPSSEWLFYGAGAGWPGFLVFTGVMLIPFFIKIKNKLPWWLLNTTAAFAFLFDIGLEVQYGVFIYSFVILWWYQWLNAEKM